MSTFPPIDTRPARRCRQGRRNLAGLDFSDVLLGETGAPVSHVQFARNAELSVLSAQEGAGVGGLVYR